MQESGRPPVVFGREQAATATAASLGAASRGARQPMPATMSRLEETRTTHRGDFPHGVAGTEFPGRIAAVSGRPVPPSDATRAYVTGVVGGAVAIVDAATNTLVSAIEQGLTNPFGIAATPTEGLCS